jgi:hypothetical protein
MSAAPTTGRLETAAQGDPDAVDDFCDLLVLWLLGLLTSYTLRGFVHILLVIAVVVSSFGLSKVVGPIP